MHKAFKNGAPDWLELLDEVKQKESIRSDAQLATTLGITRGYLCDIRKGRKAVSLKLAKTIFSHLGMIFNVDVLEQLLIPQKVRLYISDLRGTRQAVISRANGLCQLCGSEAPFQEADGTPFLEVHHLVPVANGGSSELENLVALCPNCHRKLEVCPSDEDMKKLNVLKKAQ